ncbi:MAG: 50S ribosomal protein L15 [Treponema sp.]|jgi:large subunit ribosomal protein L15|nr:50S ribosomal protein L15 [Treponema sp.]
MHDFNLHAPSGANKKKKILGRGQGCGRGTTAGRGNKGQKARSGGKTYVGFEGGQMPLYRRLARRGFSNYPFKKEFQIVNIGDIEKHFEEGETVDAASLFAKGLVKGSKEVKILGEGKFTKKLSFKLGEMPRDGTSAKKSALKISALSVAAKAKIEKAGGTVSVEESGKKGE